jgi:hypothetical protein
MAQRRRLAVSPAWHEELVAHRDHDPRPYAAAVLREGAAGCRLGAACR